MESPSSSFERDSSSFDIDFDLINIPSDALKELSPDEAISRLLLYWENLTSIVIKFANMLQCFHGLTEQNLEAVDSKLISVDAQLGVCTKAPFWDNCVTVWDDILFFDDSVGNISTSLQDSKDQQTAFNDVAQNRFQDLSNNMDNLVSDFSKRLNEVVHLVNTFNDEQGILNQRISNQVSTSQPLSASGTLDLDIRHLSHRVSELESSSSMLGG